jgi:very-short-patch-repair endonuclease
VTVHRTASPETRRPARLEGIPCTSPARTLLDLAAVVTMPELEEAIDRAVAGRLIDMAALLARLGRPVAERGRTRRGEARLRAAVTHLGYLGAPSPSVLESKVLRLLAKAGIRPRSCERRVQIDGFHYRIDVELADRVGLEVDGYAFHATAEARQRDHDRRNRLTEAGWHLLVYTWRDVVEDAERIVRQVRAVLARRDGSREA